MIGLGANLPWLGSPPESTLANAFSALERFGEATMSPLYRSAAWPDPSGPPYINAVAMVTTALAPEALLEALLATEAAYGRRRSDDPKERYAPRSLDLDLLAVGDATRASARLTLPHPRLHERDFVLRPLVDLAPDWRHPHLERSAAELLAALGSKEPAVRV